MWLSYWFSIGFFWVSYWFFTETFSGDVPFLFHRDGGRLQTAD